jgi:hypothetical protein
LKSEERTSDSDFVFDVIHVSGRMASAKVFILLCTTVKMKRV